MLASCQTEGAGTDHPKGKAFIKLKAGDACCSKKTAFGMVLDWQV